MLFSPGLYLPMGKRPAVASGFTPASLTNLIGWYEADSVGVTTSGGHVTAAPDLSGAGNNLAPLNTVPFNATSSYNSHPAFDFVAANDACLITTQPPAVTLPVTNLLSVYVVGQMKSPTVNFGGAVSIGQSGNADFQIAGNIVALSRTGVTNSIETFYNNSTDVVDTAISLATNVRIGVVVSGTSKTAQYINGTLTTQGAGTFTFGPLASPNAIVIGNRWNGTTGAGSAWDGPIVFALVAAAAWTPTDITNIDNYATGKYGT